MLLMAAIWLGHDILAFLTFDLFLRVMPVGVTDIRQMLRRWSLRYAGVTLVAVGISAALVADSAALVKLVSLAADALPWWLFWRFGLRKQFTFLYAAGSAEKI